nr:hypothetical protein [Tanacetum cinerariifolium]
MLDCDEMFSSKTDESFPASPKYDRYQSGKRYHAVPPPYTRTFMPPKPDLVFHDASNVNETTHTAFNVELKSTSFVQPTKQVKPPRPSVKPVENSILAANHKTAIPKPKRHGNIKNRKACFVLLTKSKLVPITAARPVTTAVPKPHVTRPRLAKIVVTNTHSPPKRNINRRPSSKPSNFPLRVTTVKVPKVNAVKGVPGNWTERQLLAGRLNMLFRDRRTHAYTRQLMETEARMSREAWVRATDASDHVHGEVMSLRTTVLGQMSEIKELQAADRRRQTVISELLRIDHRRSTETSELRTSLQGQVTALQGQVTALQGQVTALQAQVTTLQGQQGLARDHTQSELPEEAGGSA